MKPISLTEAESVIIGTRFEYKAPGDWEDECGLNWTYLDRNVAPAEIPALEEMERKKLVCHMVAKEWPDLVNEDCWVLTEHGLSIFSWFHSFSENIGM